ncbi:MAG: PfkB family carbohydrate kinase, partial [Myxococcota bacterium]|nr:PfkB family carbohydrate kinase [Myxococcota bacterium]
MIVSLGEALMDLIHGPGGAAPEARVGGSPYNVAIALSRLGVDAGFVCPFSTDDYGQRLARVLEEEGVRRCVEEWVEAPTATAEVFTDPSGHPSYVFRREGTADRALWERPPIDALPESLEVLHVGSLVLAQEGDWPAWREAIAAARSRGVFIAFDPNLRVALIDDMERYRSRLDEAV